MTRLSIRRLVQWCAFPVLLLAARPALAQLLLVADEGTHAAAYRSQVGRAVTFICPAKLNTNREIWGTDTYHLESPVCTAAVHAGALTRGTSGQVTIVIGPEAASFEGTSRNGVKSSSADTGDATYSFRKGEPGQIEWRTTLDRLPDDFHEPLTLICPPNGNADSGLWGADVYTAASAICLAAVHAGAISMEHGGRITVTLQPKQEIFIGSERNKVESRKWSNWDFKSYPQPFKIERASGPRTIALTGFTAAGSGPRTVPRTISLKGFEATGSGPLVVPRTIPVGGWTSVGTAQ